MTIPDHARQYRREQIEPGREPLATAEQVAAYVGVPITTLHQWRYHGRGPRASKVGRWLRYRWSDVEQWLDEQAKQAS